MNSPGLRIVCLLALLALIASCKQKAARELTNYSEALGQVLALCEQYFSQLLGQRMVRRLRCDLYVKLQRLSLRFYDRSSVGDLIHRITVDTVGLQDVVTYGFVPLAVQFLTAIAIAGTVFALDARLGDWHQSAYLAGGGTG